MKISLVLMVMLAFNLTYSNNNPKRNNKKVTFVTFNNVKAGSKLTLKKVNGSTMYSEVIETPGKFTKQFDFTLVPEGDYTFEMEKGFEVKIKSLTISSNDVTFISDDEIKFFKPVVTLKDNQVLISQLALNKKPLSVQLYYEGTDSQEVIVFKGDFTNNDKLIIEKVLSLSKNHKGDYRLVMSTNDHVYIENFEI